jgi:hypothetical protein
LKEELMFHEDAMGARRHKWGEMSAGKRALMVCGGIAAFAAALTLCSLAVMLIWNRVMSGVLGLAPLRFWDAFWLLLLAKILLGGRGHPFLGRMRMRRAMRERMAKRAAGEEENLD